MRLTVEQYGVRHCIEHDQDDLTLSSTLYLVECLLRGAGFVVPCGSLVCMKDNGEVVASSELGLTNLTTLEEEE